jgi:predicted HicB family RNase H-like nuclease
VQTPKIPLGYRLAPERKSERIQLLVRPSIKKETARLAKKNGKSLNDYIESLLEANITAAG